MEEKEIKKKKIKIKVVLIIMTILIFLCGLLSGLSVNANEIDRNLSSLPDGFDTSLPFIAYTPANQAVDGTICIKQFFMSYDGTFPTYKCYIGKLTIEEDPAQNDYYIMEFSNIPTKSGTSYNYIRESVYNYKNNVWTKTNTVSVNGPNSITRIERKNKCPLYKSNIDIYESKTSSNVFFSAIQLPITTVTQAAKLSLDSTPILHTITFLLPLLISLVISFLGFRKAFQMLSQALHQA